jgi:hypothetical protein
MAVTPISADLQAAYRQVLASQVAPTTFDTDTPLTPVVIIGTAALASAADFVKITDGTDTALVNTDGSLNVRSVPSPYSNASVTGLSQVGRSAAGTTTYTVPAGKIAVIVSASVSAAVASSVSLVRSAVTYYLCEVTAASLTGQSWCGEQVMTAGEVLTCSGRACAQYYEFDA